MLEELPPLTIYEPEEVVEPEFDENAEREIIVRRVNEDYEVEGEWLMNLINSINFDDYESVNYFQKILRKTGVVDALVEKGCQDGDTVRIYDIEFEFIK